MVLGHFRVESFYSLSRMVVRVAAFRQSFILIPCKRKHRRYGDSQTESAGEDQEAGTEY